MKIKIRKATLEDAPSFIYIKNQLPFRYSDEKTNEGGFLLGTDIQTYKEYINTDYCLVAEHNGKVVGFGIVLKDKTLRSSDLWMRRHQAKWTININDFESKRSCYFEQLAFLKGHGRLAVHLAYNIVHWAFKEKHQFLFTTTVKEPIINLAAVPFIYKAGGALVGNINEHYPKIGAIKSDIYKINATDFYNAIAEYPFYKKLQQTQLNFD